MKENIKKIQKAFDLLIEADGLIGDAKYALMNSGYGFSLEARIEMDNARNSLTDPIRELDRILQYEENKKRRTVNA